MANVTVFSNQSSPSVSTVANGSLPNTTRVAVLVTAGTVVTGNDPAVIIPQFALDVTQVVSGAVVSNQTTITMFNWPEFVTIAAGASLTLNLREVKYGGVNVYLQTP